MGTEYMLDIVLGHVQEQPLLILLAVPRANITVSISDNLTEVTPGEWQR